MAPANRNQQHISPLKSRDSRGTAAAKRNLIATVDQLSAYVCDEDLIKAGLVVVIDGVHDTYAFSMREALCYIGVYNEYITMQLALLQKLGIIIKVDARLGTRQRGYYHYLVRANARSLIRKVTHQRLEAAWVELLDEYSRNHANDLARVYPINKKTQPVAKQPRRRARRSRTIAG